MDEMLRWAFGTLITVELVVIGWLIKALTGKANKDSTDKRFTELLGEVKDLRSEQQDHAKQDIKIHSDLLTAVNETKVSIATLTATINERIPPRQHNGH